MSSLLLKMGVVELLVRVYFRFFIISESLTLSHRSVDPLTSYAKFLSVPSDVAWLMRIHTCSSFLTISMSKLLAGSISLINYHLQTLLNSAFKEIVILQDSLQFFRRGFPDHCEDHRCTFFPSYSFDEIFENISS